MVMLSISTQRHRGVIIDMFCYESAGLRLNPGLGILCLAHPAVHPFRASRPFGGWGNLRKVYCSMSDGIPALCPGIPNWFLSDTGSRVNWEVKNTEATRSYIICPPFYLYLNGSLWQVKNYLSSNTVCFRSCLQNISHILLLSDVDAEYLNIYRNYVNRQCVAWPLCFLYLVWLLSSLINSLYHKDLFPLPVISNQWRCLIIYWYIKVFKKSTTYLSKTKFCILRIYGFDLTCWTSAKPYLLANHVAAPSALIFLYWRSQHFFT